MTAIFRKEILVAEYDAAFKHVWNFPDPFGNLLKISSFVSGQFDMRQNDRLATNRVGRDAASLLFAEVAAAIGQDSLGIVSPQRILRSLDC